MKENNQWHFHIKQRDLIILVVLGLVLFISAGIGSSDTDELAKTTDSAPKQTTATKNESTNRIKTVSAEYDICQCSSSPYIRAIFVFQNVSKVNLYLSDGCIDVFDKDDHLIDTEEVSAYPQVIAPGEQAVVYELLFTESLDPSHPYRVSFSIDTEEFRGEYQRLSVFDLSIGENSYGAIRILGRLTNTTGEEQGLYYTLATLYDAEGNVLAIFSDLHNDIEIGEVKSFEMMENFSHISLSDVASYTVIAYPFQFQY